MFESRKDKTELGLYYLSKQDLVTTELQSSKGLNLLRFYYRSLIVFSFILHYGDGLYTLLVNVLLVPCFLLLAFQNWGDSQSFSYLLKNSIHVICLANGKKLQILMVSQVVICAADFINVPQYKVHDIPFVIIGYWSYLCVYPFFLHLCSLVCKAPMKYILGSVTVRSFAE